MIDYHKLLLDMALDCMTEALEFTSNSALRVKCKYAIGFARTLLHEIQSPNFTPKISMSEAKSRLKDSIQYELKRVETNEEAAYHIVKIAHALEGINFYTEENLSKIIF